MFSIKKTTGAIIAGSILAFSASTINAADSSAPIKIPIKNWSSQVVMAHVIGGMFKSMGNNVEYVPIENQAAFEAVRAGDLTLVHEVWQSTMQNAYYKAMETGGLIDAGTHSLTTFEEMGFPNWVLDKGLCPGLPNWEALKDCSANFATPDSGGKGRWLEGPQSWHGDVMPNRLKGLGLDDKWTVKFAGAASALWAELDAAKKEESKLEFVTLDNENNIAHILSEVINRERLCGISAFYFGGVVVNRDHACLSFHFITFLIIFVLQGCV